MLQPKDTDWLNGFKKKKEKETRSLYTLFTRNPSQTYGHIQTESEGL